MGQAEKIPVLAVVGRRRRARRGLAVQLAHALSGEVVSCDSMQIYMTMDIATAKPTPAEMEGVPTTSSASCRRKPPFSAGRVCKTRRGSDRRDRFRGNLPILCGGTGLYGRYPAAGDPALREQQTRPTGRSFRRWRMRKGGGKLKEMLTACDPDYAAGGA